MTAGTATPGSGPLEAALFDMDGTLFDMDGMLFDSEPLWDVSLAGLAGLAGLLGGRLSIETRRRVGGGDLRDAARIVQEDLGVEADVEESAAWLLERTRQLIAPGVPWRPAARSVVESVRRRGVPTALEDSARGIAAALAAGCLVVAAPEDGAALADGHGAVVVPLESVTVDRLAGLLTARTG